MLADRLGNVIPELPLALERLLRDVAVRAKRCGARESNQRGVGMAGDQVVPILPAEGELVDRVVGDLGSQRKVGNLQVIGSEVACRQVLRAVSLVVQAVVGLRAVADIGRVSVIDCPV